MRFKEESEKKKSENLPNHQLLEKLEELYININYSDVGLALLLTSLKIKDYFFFTFLFPVFFSCFLFCVFRFQGHKTICGNSCTNVIVLYAAFESRYGEWWQNLDHLDLILASFHRTTAMTIRS